MDLVFLRHAEPAWVVDGVSRSDPQLTERGWEQAELAARRLAAERPIAEILVSPTLRTQETAAPLASLTGIVPTTVAGLEEIRMPDWTGQPEETIQALFAEARTRPPEAWWDGMEGGESFRAFHERVTATVDRLLADRGVVPDPDHHHLWRSTAEPGRIVVVGHGGTNAVAIGHLLGAEPTPWEWERFVLYHAAIARVRAVPLAGEHVFSLRAFNDREHLPRELRTR